MEKSLSFISRVFLASIFLGLVIIRLVIIFNNPDGYLQYQQLLGSFGLPGIFAPLLILIQLVGGASLLVGFKTRFFAYVLAVLAFSLALVLGRFQPEVLFLYLGITGGLIALALHPVTPYSIDHLKK